MNKPLYAVEQQLDAWMARQESLEGAEDRLQKEIEFVENNCSISELIEIAIGSELTHIEDAISRLAAWRLKERDAEELANAHHRMIRRDQ